MIKKLVLNVMFEKKRILVFFLVMCMFLILYTSIQTTLVSGDIGSVDSMPDFVFSGTVYNSQDGTYPFIGYNDIGSFREKAQEISGGAAECFGIVYRNLYNYYDELTSIGFSGGVYGMPDECIDEYIAPFVNTGNLPADGKKEAIVGYYFAQRFDISIGDQIPQAVTLNKEWDEADIDNYRVCGILDEHVSSYFNGSVVISRNTYERLYQKEEDNMLLGYYTTGENYDTIFLNLNSFGEEYQVPEGTLNFKQKEYAKLKIFVSAVVVILMSVSMMTAIISYLMKGITPKIGLLKATGVSTWYLIKVFVAGVTAVLIIATGVGIILADVVLRFMNQYVSDFYKFEVHTYQFTPLSLAIDLFEFVFIILYVLIILSVKCKRISPKIAMMKTI